MLAELETQTQEAVSSGTEVDEHAVTRSVLGERRGHIRAVGRKIRGVDGSTTASHATFAPGSSSFNPSHQADLAAALADSAFARAEAEQYRQRMDTMERNMNQLMAQLQCQMPGFQFSGANPQYPNITPQPAPNVEEDEEDEDDEEDLGDD